MEAPSDTWSKGWPAPAKLNLFLHITGRRPDGYHVLQTVFQFLDFGDELAFRVRPDGAVTLEPDLPGVAPEENLIVRAARLLQQRAGTALGADIRLIKHLPMGGGLGGGSSDAATTLAALNHLWATGLSEESLAALALELGADVPVFLRGRAAWAEGVGERLQPLELSEPWFVVLIPPVSVSTAEVFGAPQLTRNCPPITIRDFLAGAGENVCEPVVRRRYPAVAEALEALGAHGEARLTGTGACIFARFAQRREAETALEALATKWDGFAARGANRSPLLQRLEQA
jgi:4-diphosphocytidyl-2-C-methyl-D-erythritol kinase